MKTRNFGRSLVAASALVVALGSAHFAAPTSHAQHSRSAVVGGSRGGNVVGGSRGGK